jgi:hypothetical protein
MKNAAAQAIAFHGISLVAAGMAYAPALNGNEQLSVILLGVVGITHSALIFVLHGGARISGTGILGLSSGLFVFYPAAYIYSSGADFSDDYVMHAAAAALFCQIVFSAATWSDAPRGDLEHGTPEKSIAANSGAMPAGLALLAIGTSLSLLAGLGSTTLAGAASFVGVVLIAVASFSRRLTILRFFAVAAAAAVYVFTMFDGGGRLVLGGLALTIAVALNLFKPTLPIKPAIIVALPAGLAILAADRSSRVRQLGSNESGLESVVWPMERFSQLLEQSMDGTLPLRWLDSFYAAIVIFVPRSLWEEKPIGLGAQLTKMFRPELVGTGHSEAALIHGEFVYAFGLAGLAIFALLSILIARAVNRMLFSLNPASIQSFHDLAWIALVVIVAAGILDLVWVGTFGFASRTGQRVLVLGLCWAAVSAIRMQWRGSALRPRLRVQRRAGVSRAAVRPKRGVN